MAHVLVANADAGSADRDAVEAAASELRRGDEEVDVVETATPEDLDEVVAEVEDGDVLVACGGDGSIHALVAAVRRAGRLDGLAFGLVPLGTGNDLARALELPLDDAAAAAARVRDGQPRRLDLVTLEGGAADLCVNALHGGVGVDAAARAEALKERLGKVAYPLGALAAGATADGWAVTVEVDGEALHDAQCEGRALLVAICNAHGFGGGTVVAPGADPSDGLVDVVVSTALGPAARAAFGAALARGTHLDRDDVVHARGAVVRVHGERIGWNVDGELDEDGTTDRTFRVEPHAWTLLA